MLTPFGYFDLFDEMQQPGCAICNLMARDVKNMLNTILYEYVTEPEMHAQFRASRGLCNVHGWQLTELGNVMSIATLYVAVVDEVLKALNHNSPDAKSQRKRVRQLFNRNDNGAVVNALEHNRPCPVCAKRDEYEGRYIKVFADHLSDNKLLSAYRQSDGLCLGHFMQILSETSDDAGSQLLVEIQRDHWQKLKTELDEFVRKYDYNNLDEAMGDERDSWLRAVKQMTGNKGVFGMRQ